jgi:hypothetical protein
MCARKSAARAYARARAFDARTLRVCFVLRASGASRDGSDMQCDLGHSAPRPLTPLHCICVCVCVPRVAAQRVFYFWGLQQDSAGPVVLPSGKVLPPRWVIKDMMWQVRASCACVVRRARASCACACVVRVRRARVVVAAVAAEGGAPAQAWCTAGGLPHTLMLPQHRPRLAASH